MYDTFKKVPGEMIARLPESMRPASKCSFIVAAGASPTWRSESNPGGFNSATALNIEMWSGYRKPQPIIPTDYDRSAWVCIGPDGLVRSKDGLVKKICELKCGDFVESKVGFSKINKVYASKSELRELCKINDTLILTHRHPLLLDLDKDWSFPSDHFEVYIDDIEVYNFEMEGEPCSDNHTIVVSGIMCATLGLGPACLANRSPYSQFYGKDHWSRKIS